MKPPNILILSDNEAEFSRLKTSLKTILGSNIYVIYRLSSDDMLHTSQWTSGCVMLLTTLRLPSAQVAAALEYLSMNGIIISVPDLQNNTNISLSHSDTPNELYSDLRLQRSVSSDGYFCSYTLNGKGRHLVTKVKFDFESVDNLNTFEKDLYRSFFKDELKLRVHETTVDSDINLVDNYQIFVQNPDLTASFQNELRSHLGSGCIISSTVHSTHEHFNANVFQTYLNTKHLGHVVLYTHVASSTMNTINNLPELIDSVVVIACQQTAGKGNNENEWLSPLGCATFTVYLRFTVDQLSSSHIDMFQFAVEFAAALACVNAIKKTTDHEALDIKIKWPNDIFYRGVKLGGILARSSITDSQMTIKIGIGFNVSNEYPTDCLNRILATSGLATWSREEFIAKVLNYLEVYIEQLCVNRARFMNDFRDEFRGNWMHTDQKVTVDEWKEQVDVMGIDEHGYLCVKRPDGSEHRLRPGINRFDMMKNMIVLR